MDGKVGMRGISLIELLVVMVVLGILMALAIPAFDRWRLKISIENDARSIYALIQKARTLAFARKIDLTVQTNSANACIYEGTNQLECIALTNPFSGSITVTRRGYFSTTGSIRYVGNANVYVNYDCVVVSVNRVRLGKWDGSSCDAK